MCGDDDSPVAIEKEASTGGDGSRGAGATEAVDDRAAEGEIVEAARAVGAEPEEAPERAAGGEPEQAPVVDEVPEEAGAPGERPEDGGAPEAGSEAMGASEAMLLSRIESLVFTSPEPMSVRKLACILSLEGTEVRRLAGILKAHYERRGIVFEEISKGFQFRSHPDNAAMVRDVFKLKPVRMSRAALETLAIVAYRQTLTRAEVEEIRGVDSGGVLKYLFEKELVRVIGRKEEAGRPIIYGTSKGFLELFGLKSLADLPALHEFSELWEEHQKLVDEEAPLSEDKEGSDGGDGTEMAAQPEQPGGSPAQSEEQPEMDRQREKPKDNVDEAEQDQPKYPSDMPTETLDQKELDDIVKSVAPRGKEASRKAREKSGEDDTVESDLPGESAEEGDASDD